MTRPDNVMTLIVLNAVPGEPGVFRASRVAAQSGVYHLRIMAAGRTSREQRFTREATRTAAVWRGGNQPGGGSGPGAGPVSGDGGPGGGRDWCAILECPLGHGVLSGGLLKRLQAEGVDLQRFRTCLCQPRRGDGPR